MSALDITLSPEETNELKRRIRSATIPQREGRRARIILLAAEGGTRDNIARLTGFSCPTITHWCQRFQVHRLDGLVDKPGRGRKSSLPAETVRGVLEQVTRPRSGEPRWSCRMARAAGISSTPVHELWAVNDLKPHLTRTFKLINDPQFEEKFWDVIGLYLAPPDKALVLCRDEKSQVQA
ncbi:IS630 family transposase ISPsy25 [Pseudomonas fluorescens]|uniref:IS630 family transposase ISPsy25 n=1 Tax=Pseudomonas fluorescens TaxID=294 RepID=A0A5E7WUZ8_PSEFL|nr:IS630 family transposase ISPsy25 [Pseudomonas fluorescens]